MLKLAVVIPLVKQSYSAGYFTQFPRNGVYQLDCEDLSSSICSDLCSRCTEPLTKPFLEDCVFEQSASFPQGGCNIGTKLILSNAVASGWTSLLPNTTYGYTSILLPSNAATSLTDVILSIELTTDVNTPFLNDEYYKIPEGQMPTTTPRDNTDDTPPQILLDAYLMEDAPLSPFSFDICRGAKYSASLLNIPSSQLIYTPLTSPAPLPTPYPHTLIPRLITFTVDISSLFVGNLPSQPYWCINLDWSRTPPDFYETVVISNVYYSGTSSGAYRLQTDGEPEIYPVVAPPPGLNCEACQSQNGVSCTKNPEKYDTYFDDKITDTTGPHPYQRQQRCCRDASICEGDIVDCSGTPVHVSRLS